MLIKTYQYSILLVAKSPLNIERRSRVYTKNCTDHFLRTFQEPHTIFKDHLPFTGCTKIHISSPFQESFNA